MTGTGDPWLTPILWPGPRWGPSPMIVVLGGLHGHHEIGRQLLAPAQAHGPSRLRPEYTRPSPGISSVNENLRKGAAASGFHVPDVGLLHPGGVQAGARDARTIPFRPFLTLSGPGQNSSVPRISSSRMKSSRRP